MKSVRKALALSLASQYTVQLVQFVSVVTLSRLLTPEEIGVYSVGAAVVLVAATLRAYGITEYIVHAENLTEERMRRGIGMVFIMAWSVALVLLLGAPTFAEFYGEPGLSAVLRIMAAGFFLAPFMSVPYAVMMRELAFDLLMRVDALGALTQAGVTIGCALAGLGYLSMAWGLLAGTVVELVLIQHHRPSHVPILPAFQKLREVFAFGTYTGFSNLLARSGDGVPDLVLGRFGSMQDVGIFSRSVGLVMLFDRAVLLAVRPVVLPHFSEQHRESQALQSAFVRAVELHTGLAWPFFAALSVLSLPLVRLLYGDQWDAAAPTASLLAAWGALLAVYCYANDALIAAGEVRLVLMKEAASMLCRLIAVLIGAQFGLQGVALALVASGGLDVCLAATAARIGAGISVRAVLSACLRSAWSAILVLAALQLGLPWIEGWTTSPFLTLLASGVLALCGWVAGLTSSKHPLLAEIWRLRQRAGREPSS